MLIELMTVVKRLSSEFQSDNIRAMQKQPFASLLGFKPSTLQLYEKSDSKASVFLWLLDF